MFEYLKPLHPDAISNHNTYAEGQYGKSIDIHTPEHEPNWQAAHIVILSVTDMRGNGQLNTINHTLAIRQQLYNLYNWHSTLAIADLGNIHNGQTLADTYAATEAVLTTLLKAHKIIIILGNSHDVALAQYNAYKKLQQSIEYTNIDAVIDMSLSTALNSERFLVALLTQEPNYVHHYNHLGFQSYLAHPNILETLNHIRFDCVRLGTLRQQLAEHEPTLRNSNMVTIDVNSIQPAYMPCNTLSPNGLAGDEACQLAQYAGSSTSLSTFGIYNYNSTTDVNSIGAKQIAQMIWYFVHGCSTLLNEDNITNTAQYYEYNILFGDVPINFYQNKHTHRWWMQLAPQQYLACTKSDYEQASNNQIPERWLRAKERLA